MGVPAYNTHNLHPPLSLMSKETTPAANEESTLQTIKDRAVSEAKDLADTRDTFVDNMTKVEDTLEPAYEKTAGFVEKAYDKTADFVGDAYDKTADFVGDAYDKTADVVGDAFEKTKNWVKDIFDGDDDKKEGDAPAADASAPTPPAKS